MQNWNRKRNINDTVTSPMFIPSLAVGNVGQLKTFAKLLRILEEENAELRRQLGINQGAHQKGRPI